MARLVTPAIPEHVYDTIQFVRLSVVLPSKNNNGRMQADYVMVDGDGNYIDEGKFSITSDNLKADLDANPGLYALIQGVQNGLQYFATAKAEEVFAPQAENVQSIPLTTVNDNASL